VLFETPNSPLEISHASQGVGALVDDLAHAGLAVTSDLIPDAFYALFVVSLVHAPDGSQKPEHDCTDNERPQPFRHLVLCTVGSGQPSHEVTEVLVATGLLAVQDLIDPRTLAGGEGVAHLFILKGWRDGVDDDYLM
jgi:hypothetical protein